MAKIKSIQTHNFVLESEKELPEDEKSIFIIQDLEPMKAAAVYDILFEDGKFSMSLRSCVRAAELGIIGWKNVLNEENEQLKFSLHMIKLLSPSVLTEIGSQILKNTFAEFQVPLETETDGETENPFQS